MRPGLHGRAGNDPAVRLGENLIRTYREMVRIRVFEETVLRLRLAGSVAGSIHLCIGQEAIPVGVSTVRAPQDVVFATYRGHGWALAWGAPPEALFAEICGRATGTNGGRAGSAMLSYPASGFMGENSIVGAGAPIAVGAGLAATFDGSGRVAIAVFGDGAVNQGALHEALNFAAVYDLPVIFICENNGWSELTPIEAMVRDPLLANRATAYGISGERIDGNDVEAVAAAAKRAFDRARAGEGPSFIEAITARLVGHYVGDPDTVRTEEERARARADEPLARIRRAVHGDAEGSAALEAIDAEVTAEMDEAAERALAAPTADPLTVREHLYA